MPQRIDGLLQGLSLRQRQTHFAVTAEIACRGQNQITKTGQTGKGLRAGTQRHAQARHFGQAAGNQCSAGVQPQLQAITQTGCNGQYVFDCSAYFNTYDVIVGIDAQRWTVKSCNQGIAHF